MKLLQMLVSQTTWHVLGIPHTKPEPPTPHTHTVTEHKHGAGGQPALGPVGLTSHVDVCVLSHKRSCCLGLKDGDCVLPHPQGHGPLARALPAAVCWDTIAPDAAAQ